MQLQVVVMKRENATKKVRLTVSYKRDHKCSGKVRCIWPEEDWNVPSEERTQFNIYKPPFSALVSEQRIGRN